MEENIEAQNREYLEPISNTIPLDIVDDIADFAKDAPVHRFYADHPDVRFLYEMLERDGWREKVRKVADLWVQQEDNLRRATKAANRQVKVAPDRLIRAFCIFRFKEVAGEDWTYLEEGLGVDNKPQTIVLIALDDWDLMNGFSFNFPRGSDICVDGHAPLRFPPTGGGRGMWISLDI